MMAYNHGTNLEKLYYNERRSNIRFQRSMAKHVPKKELDRSKTRAKLLENNLYSNVKSTSEDLLKYAQIKKKRLNDLDMYKQNYKHRYSKKNILGKIDCYCEKKIFDKYDRIYELAEKLKNDKKSFSKKVDKNFGIPLILFALVPVLGLIIPLLFNKYYSVIFGCFSDCDKEEHLNNTLTGKLHKTTQEYNIISISKSTGEIIGTVNFVFLCVSTVIVSCIVLYIFIKVIKYNKLKAGRDKMSLKEYYHFTKSLI